MPQLDLGSVLGPQGPKGDPGNQGTVGPRGPQGEQGDAGKDATINGVNALTIETGDGLEATMTGSAYNLKLTDNTLNAVRVVPTFTRPNLLDNWYFGRPVDQRGGYISLQGVPVYNDAACTSLIGNQIETAATCIKSGTNYERRINGQGGGFVKAADVVRGYTGNWIFTVDRWSLSGPSSSRVLTIRDGAIHLQGGTLPDDYIFQRVPYVPVGEYCFSVLFRGNTGRIALSNKLTDMSLVTAAVTSANAGLLTLHYKLDSQLSDGDNFFRINFDGECDIIAAKLELGPTQTLAHQENGAWVLNEVPEYGGQLRRCQRYHYQVHYNQYETIGFAYDGPEYAFIILPLPTEMRGETPTLKIIGDISIGGKVRTLTGCNCHGCEAIIGVNYTAQPSSAGATYAYSTSAGGVTISIIYDL